MLRVPGMRRRFGDHVSSPISIDVDQTQLKRIVFAFPGDLATPTGGYIYDRRIIGGLEALGWTVDQLSLGDGFPWPSAAQVDFAQRVLLDIPTDCPVVIDGLAFAVIPELAQRLSACHPLIALVHHPLALESGLTAQQVQMLQASEIAALTYAQHVIVTSPATAKGLSADFGVQASRISVVCPGTDRAQLARGSQDQSLHLLSVGSIVPRKGFDILIAALATLTDLPWQLTIAGDRTRDAIAPAQLDRDIERFGLAGRISSLGAVSAEVLESLYMQADLFVLASRFEGYGMAFAEALAHGLPVVGTTAGAIPDTVPPGAGVLVAPNDVPQLAQALRQIMTDPVCREQLSRAALQAAHAQPTWQDSATEFSKILGLFV